MLKVFYSSSASLHGNRSIPAAAFTSITILKTNATRVVFPVDDRRFSISLESRAFFNAASVVAGLVPNLNPPMESEVIATFFWVYGNGCVATGRGERGATSGGCGGPSGRLSASGGGG